MKRLSFAVFLVSVSLLGFEVSLLQVLSFVQWHHFATMVIAIALLGFGVSGTIISLGGRWMIDRFDRLVPTLLLLTAIAMGFGVPLTQIPGVRFDSYLIFVEWQHAAALVLTYLILAIPFTLGALVIGLSFVRFTNRVGQLYFANLLGSGVGAVLPVVMMWEMEPAALAALFALVSAVAALVTTAGGGLRYGPAAAMAGIVLCLALAAHPPVFQPSQFKDIGRALDLPDAQIVYQDPSPLGTVQVTETPVTRSAPGLSLHYRGHLPARDLVFVNGNAVGAIPDWTPGDTSHVLNFTTLALPYILDTPSRVLILESGTGEAASHALANGADRVVAVEPNPAIGLAAKSLGSKLPNHPSVENRAVQPRSFLRGGDGPFDLIALPDAGRFGGSVGLHETQENYLMTVEALDDMWDLIDERGAIVIRAWMDYPYRYPLRVLALLVDVAHRNGLSLDHHIVAVRSWSDATFVLKKSPVDASQSDRVRQFASNLGFDPLLLPRINSDERNRRNELQDTTLFSAVDALTGPDRLVFIDHYDFHIAPPTDDRPYFSRFVRWDSLLDLADQFGGRTLAFFGLGLFIAALTLLQALILSILLILAPLSQTTLRRIGLLRTLLYFSALGAGFMLVEIFLIQRFTLFLGEPVYAVSTVLAGILIGSGVGAYRSSGIPATGWTVAAAALIVAGLGPVYLFMLSPVFEASFGLPLLGRAVLVAILLIPISYVMGHPFPLGLRFTSRTAESQVPWAWGVNGCMSVLGAAAAPLISIEWGFTTLLLTGCGAYLIAGIAFLASAKPVH